MKGGALLTGNIVLPDDFDLVAVEGLGGEVIILQAKGKGIATAGAYEEGVDVMDVDLGLHEGAGDGLEEGFIFEFHRDEPALHVREIVLDEEVLRFFGIVHDESNDGTVSGIKN